MPTRVGIACPTYGCPDTSGDCPTHGRTAKQRAVKRERGSAAAMGYDADWKRFRTWHMRECVRLSVDRAGLCGARLPGAPLTTDSLCAQQGLIVPARVLDHIRPIKGKDDPGRLDPTNTQWLCDGTMSRNACHDRKRAEESRRCR